MADQALGGYDPYAGLSAHEAGRPQLIPVPSLLRALLSEHLDPGYAAAAAKRDRSGEPQTGRARALGWMWQALAALLVATVFAAAVAQARLVAPGVSAAQRVLAGGVRSEEASTGALSGTPQRAHRAARRRSAASVGRRRRRAGGCWPASTGSAWPPRAPRSSARV